MKITTLCASVLALTVVSQAHAEPTARMTTESGADRSGFVEYDLSYPQFDGVSDELNQAIKALAMRPVTEIVTLQAQEAGSYLSPLRPLVGVADPWCKVGARPCAGRGCARPRRGSTDCRASSARPFQAARPV